MLYLRVFGCSHAQAHSRRALMLEFMHLIAEGMQRFGKAFFVCSYGATEGSTVRC